MEGSVKRANTDLNFSAANSANYSQQDQSFSHTSRVKQIWAIGGGKGGVGKSLVASSLAIALSRQGNRVVACDMDLGGANLHTALGVDLPKQTLSDFFSGRTTRLQDCVAETPLPRLSILSGAQDAVGITNVTDDQRTDFIRGSHQLDSDYVILDLGAGTAFHTLDFFLSADIGLITVLPEPTSIENTYRFIKSAYFRSLWASPHLKEIKPLIEMAMDSKNPLGIKSPSDLYREVNRSSPESAIKLKREIERFRPKLIVNQARTQADAEIGNSIKTVCKKYFGIDLDYLGALDYDSAVWQSVRRKRPLLLEFPNSKLVSAIEQITQNIVRRYASEKNELFSFL